MASAFPEVDDGPLGLINIQGAVTVLAPYSQVFYLPPVGNVIIIADRANHSGVICNLNEAVALVPGKHIAEVEIHEITFKMFFQPRYFFPIQNEK